MPQKKANKRTDGTSKAAANNARRRRPLWFYIEADPGSKTISKAIDAYIGARIAMQDVTRALHRQEKKLLAVLERERSV